MQSAPKDEESNNYSEIKHTTEELLKLPTTVTTTKSDDKLFEQFKRFKEETTLVSDSENMKKRLIQSIHLWNELLNLASQANEKNKNNFDPNRASILKVFSDVYEADLFNTENEFSRQTFFAYLDLLNTPEVQQFLSAFSPSTIAASTRESNIYMILLLISPYPSTRLLRIASFIVFSVY